MFVSQPNSDASINNHKLPLPILEFKSPSFFHGNRFKVRNIDPTLMAKRSQIKITKSTLIIISCVFVP